MVYSDFAEKFLTALYYETEANNAQYLNAETLIKKYGLEAKDHWISRISDDWENWYFKEVSKVLGGYDHWSFRISGEGSRYIEEKHGSLDQIEKYLGIYEEISVEAATNRLLPASDRFVSFGDNLEQRDQAVASIEEIYRRVSSSNELDEEDKAETVLSLKYAKELILGSRKVLVGAIHYLVLERIKRAFEKTIEDAIRVVIIASLLTLVGLILALV